MPNISGFSAFPGYFGSDQIVVTCNGPAGHGQNVTGTSGGALLGVSKASLQNTRLFTTDYGYPYLGQRNVYSDNKPVIASTINGVAKAISAGVFGSMVAQKYILMGFTSQVAGIKTGVLSTILTFTGGHYNVVGQNLANTYRNTWVKRGSGGWYYQTGQPVNAQYSRDNFGTDKQGTAKSPGQLVFMVGNPVVITTQNYQARNG